MQTLSSGNIATWQESSSLFGEHGSIATESQERTSPAWEECVDSLLGLWRNAADALGSCDRPPNRDSIESAINWLVFLRDRFPSAPPTYITAEPAGGIIIERRLKVDANDLLCELTFYNDGRAERTDYCNGHVVQMGSIPSDPLEAYCAP